MDVLVSNIRPYFRKIWFADRNGGCSNDVLVFRALENCYPNFLYYALSDNNFFDYATSTSKGTKMPRGDKKAIMDYDVPKLPLPVQIAISEILSSLDAKITLNKRKNDYLEQTARAIYKNWFVDFGPFRDGEFIESELGEIPAGWRVGTLSELITIKYGKDHKKLADGSIPVFGSGGIMRFVDTALYRGESVLIPRKGTLNNVIYIDRPFWSVDTMFFTEMNHPNLAKFVYFFVQSKDLASMNAGSAVPSMTTEILNALPIVIPPYEELARFEEVVGIQFSQMQENQRESETLAILRDTLLPRLMSGELSVADI
jgi:type I restriction enzyme S subunit